jgi:hypothetical protein
MKKTFTFLSLVLAFGLTAQNYAVFLTDNSQTAHTQTLVNGSVISMGTGVTTNTAAPHLTTFYVLLENKSASQITLNVVRRIVYNNAPLKLDGAGNIPDTYFCFGYNCFSSIVSQPTSADYCVLGAMGSTVTPDNSKDNGTPFVIDLAENTTIGKYYVNYKVYDVNNPNDSVSFVVKYNETAIVPNTIQAWSLDPTFTSTVQALPNGATANYTTSAAAATEVHVKFKNTDPSNTYTYSIVRKDVQLFHFSTTDTAKAHFCFGDLGSCYNQFLFEPTSDFVTLGPGGTTTGANHIITDLDEATGSTGYSIINYKLFNKATGKSGPGADTLSFTFKYNSLTGIKENKGLFENVSDVYPNPSTNNANITVVLTDEVPVKVQVYNSLGTLVYNGAEQQMTGKNRLGIDCSNFSNGLYFITVSAGNAKITKRLVVNK